MTPPISPADPDRTSSFADRARFVGRVVQLRLRFVLLLAALAAVLLGWAQVRSLADLLDDWWSASVAGPGGISPDTEYFCPMCPGVLTQWPEKCPVCKMPLVRRKKGDATLLPEGVLARMQLTPQRVQLAGIRTSVARFLPLRREFSVNGRLVRRDESGGVCEFEVAASDAAHVAAGDEVALRPAMTSGDAAGPERKGRVASVAAPQGEYGRATVRVETKAALANEAPRAWRATFSRPMAEVEPFRSQPRRPAPPDPAAPKVLFTCAEHPDYLHVRGGRCPFDEAPLDHAILTPLQRVTWRCPYHEDVDSPVPAVCERCEGRPLLPRVTNYVPDGQVLAIPTSAIVDTVAGRIVFLERGPGMFDGVLVTTGERCGDETPVFAGVAAGDRVVSDGALLLDAESRLNAGVAGAYFGAGGAGGGESDSAVLRGASAKGDELDALELTPRDRAWARAQKTCPVTKLPLGGMGDLDPVLVRGRFVYLCCEGCRATIAEDALAEVPKPAAKPPAEPSPDDSEAKDAAAERPAAPSREPGP